MIAGSDFCPIGTLAYDDGMAISCQLHPEFAPDFSIALIEGRRGERIPDEQAAAGDREPEGPRRPRPVRRLDAGFLEGG